MSPERQQKQLERRLRGISVNAIRPWIASFEDQVDGRWCLVAGSPTFIKSDGATTETTIDDDLVFAQLLRWLTTQPERVHETHQSAISFVRSQRHSAS